MTGWSDKRVIRFPDAGREAQAAGASRAQPKGKDQLRRDLKHGARAQAPRARALQARGTGPSRKHKSWSNEQEPASAGAVSYARGSTPVCDAATARTHGTDVGRPGALLAQLSARQHNLSANMWTTCRGAGWGAARPQGGPTDPRARSNTTPACLHPTRHKPSSLSANDSWPERMCDI